jgi:hypothetical protein
MDFLKKFLKSFTTKVDDTSKPGKVDATDVAKVLRTATYVGLAAGLTFLIAPDQVGAFGEYQGIALIALTGLLELVNKFVKDNAKE